MKKENDQLPARVDASSPVMRIEGKAGTFQIVKRQVGIPADLCYVIQKPKFDRQGRLVKAGKGGVLSSGYDILAREGAFKWTEVAIQQDEDFKTKVGIGAKYYNSKGNLVEDFEVYEIDVKALFQHARANWTEIDWKRTKAENEFETVETRYGFDGKEKKVVVSKPVADLYYDETGEPIVTFRLPKKAEIDLFINVMLHLRKTKLAKCITCCKRRVTQRAYGLKGIVIENEGWEKEITVDVYNAIQVAGSTGEKPTLELVDDLYDPEMVDPIQRDESEIEPDPPPKKTRAPPTTPPDFIQTRSSSRPNSSPLIKPRQQRSEPEPEPKAALDPESSEDPILIIVDGDTINYIAVLKSDEFGFQWGPKGGYKLGKVWVKECENSRAAELVCNLILELPDHTDNSKQIYDTGALKLFSMGPGDKKPVPIN